MALGAAVLVAAGGIGAYFFLQNQAPTDENQVTGQNADETAGSTNTNETDSVETVDDPPQNFVAGYAISSPVSGPYVQFDWDGQRLALSGLVPDEILAGNLEQIAISAYTAERVDRSGLMVDPNVGPAPEWLTASPGVAPQLHLMSKASAVVSDGRIQVAGTAEAADDVTYIDKLIADATGLPVEIRGVEISSLRDAVWFVRRSGEAVQLSGGLPTEALRTGFVDAAVSRYGQVNLRDSSTVDPTVGPALWMYEPEQLFDAFAGFTEVDLEFSGEQFRFELGGGPSFESGSNEKSAELTAALDFLAVTLTREPTMELQVTGHTDSSGSAEANLALSQARAEAAQDYLVAAGIKPERIEAEGLGSAEPIDDNGTPEGRARNRRIEMTMIRTPLGY